MTRVSSPVNAPTLREPRATSANKAALTVPSPLSLPPLKQESTQIAQHPKSVSAPVILPDTADKFKACFLTEFNQTTHSHQSPKIFTVEEKKSSNGERDGYVLKSYDGANELPQFKLNIFENGKISASNLPPGSKDQEILAEKMVAAFLAAGNKPPGPANINCSDSTLHNLISTKLKNNRFEMLPLKERAESQRENLSPDAANNLRFPQGL